MQADVIVIGAGIAGLRCAALLADDKIDVQVLEASSRVGGRTWSQTLSNGAIIERGAEFLHERDGIVRKVLEELELDLVPAGFSFGARRTLEENPITPEENIRGARAIEEHHRRLVDEGDESVTTMRDVVVSAPVDEAIRRSYTARFEGSNGAKLEQMSAQWYRPKFLSGDPDPLGHLREGNQAISERLAARLQDRVHLRRPVESVDQRAEGVVVRDTRGDEWSAKVVVSTVPHPLFRQLKLSPELSEAALAAHELIGYGTASKLSVAVNDPVEGAPDVVQDLEAPYWAWPVRGREDGPVVAVTAYAGREDAKNTLVVDRGPLTWLEKLRQALPAARNAEEAVVTDWSADPWAQGAFSHFLPGWNQELQDALIAPHGRLVIAGDWTVWGGVPGALESAERAAQEASALLGRSAPDEN